MENVYLIGPRYKHHSSHSGYEGFHRYIGTPLKPPIKRRFMTGSWGWRVDTTVTKLTSRPYYSLGLLLIEGAAALHMITHRKSLYHAIYGDTDLWLLPQISWIAKKRLVATFHEPPSTLGFMSVDERITKNLAAVILLSESQRCYFENFFPTERTFVVPHGVDTEFFHPGVTSANEPTCLTVGSHLRDFDTLKKAMAIVWKHNPNVRLVAIGTRRSKDPNPQLKIEDKRVRYLEGISDQHIKQAYHGARLAVFSLKDATASNAILESMACGLPIVATDIGGVKEYLGDEAGILCKPQDPEALANEVLRLLDDSSLVRSMSEAARKRALEFDYRIMADKMSKAYGQILMSNSN